MILNLKLWPRTLVLSFKDGDTQICRACGAPLTGAQPLVCHKCGFLNKSDVKYCANCGATLL
ncbi:MAG: zinc-ribbon domain-containing protein [Anaerolineae bacterium]|nr:zinc-ribbon domain-containing protein [Anaerolineae bacterium]